MRKALITAWLVSLLLNFPAILNPSPVYACSCAEPPSVKEELDRSEAVFAGRVLNVKKQRSFKGYLTNSVLFEVSHIWKGGPESQIMIRTGSGGGDCGYHFEEGEEYLVYANPSNMYGDKELLVTIICDRTRELTEAKEDLAVLGDGEAPTEQVDLEGELDRSFLSAWVTATFIAIAGLTILYMRRKKMNKTEVK